mmetsp:Transcript_40901/g.73254  ORF Transcript_40901/g.73254 Transcript_40901/m.73254 type:complete len:202 (+) Transcript_40901:102-707(+)
MAAPPRKPPMHSVLHIAFHCTLQRSRWLAAPLPRTAGMTCSDARDDQSKNFESWQKTSALQRPRSSPHAPPACGLPAGRGSHTIASPPAPGPARRSHCWSGLLQPAAHGLPLPGRSGCGTQKDTAQSCTACPWSPCQRLFAGTPSIDGEGRKSNAQDGAGVGHGLRALATPSILVRNVQAAGGTGVCRGTAMRRDMRKARA